MKSIVIYIHGKGGDAAEAEHYKPLFPEADVLGFDYRARTPWEAKAEFPPFFEKQTATYDRVTLIANSIGAFFSMNALSGARISRALWISPIVDMETLIGNMMDRASVTEEELCRRRKIPTDFGETLSWDYLCYVREHPIVWNIPTRILYGENDCLTSPEAIADFSERIRAPLTVMKQGEHWFHTEEQMRFLDDWIKGIEGL